MSIMKVEGGLLVETCPPQGEQWKVQYKTKDNYIHI